MAVLKDWYRDTEDLAEDTPDSSERGLDDYQMPTPISQQIKNLHTFPSNRASSTDRYSRIFAQPQLRHFGSVLHEDVFFRRPSTREIYHDLLQKCMLEVGMLSDLREVVLNKNYQQIIGMGEPVIPYLIETLRKGEFDMRWALQAITRKNPANEAPNFSEAVDMWLNWYLGNNH